MDLSASIKTDLLLGTIDADEGGDYNAALLVSDGGEKIQVYRKLHLVPFGEYVPGRHTVPFISSIVGDQVPADFTPGKEATVFNLTNAAVKVAPLICFEDTLGELTRQFVLRGANLLANVTNDGWFLRFGRLAAASGQRGLPLRRDAAPDGARGQHRRDLFCESLRPRDAGAARCQREPVYRGRADRRGGGADRRTRSRFMSGTANFSRRSAAALPCSFS